MRTDDEDTPAASPAAPELDSPSGPTADPGPGLSKRKSEECYFCGQRVYVLERIGAEGRFFHRSCFTCHQCGVTLRLGGYTFERAAGRFLCELHSEDLDLENGTDLSLLCKDGEINHKGTAEENSSGDDRTPSPSDEEYEHTLDFGPYRHSRSHQPRGKEVHPRLHSKKESHESQPSKPLAGAASNSEVAAPSVETGEVPPSEPRPVPKPRFSRQTIPGVRPSSPIPKPRTISLSNPSHPDRHASPTLQQESADHSAAPDSRPKQSLRKLQLTAEEKSQLVNLQSFSLDSDSETPGGSSSCSSSSATAVGPCPPKPAGLDRQEEESYWSGGSAGHNWEKRNRRCLRRKEEPGGQTRVRSKFSPWNLSSPRLSRDHRLSVLSKHPGSVETTFRHSHSNSEDGIDGDDDDDDNEDELFGRDDIDLLDEKFQTMPSNPVEAEKFELMKMRTLERRAKMSELQRFRKAQSIQRRLEEIEVTYKELEEAGVLLERSLRGEAGSGGSPEMMEQWLQLVHQRSALLSEESDLMMASRQLELEDKQSMLEQELRAYMELIDKTPGQQAEEDRILLKMIEVVDMRDSLVTFLDEMRLKEMSEEQEAFSIREAKRHSMAGAQDHWS